MSVDDFRLCLVKGKFQPLQYLSQHRHCLAGFISPAEDDNIVSISDNVGSQSLLQVIPLPYPVQYRDVVYFLLKVHQHCGLLNRRMPTFFSDNDYRAYLDLMGEWCRKCGVAVWAYCLMPNHVHLVAVPEHDGSLHRAIGEAHRRYSRMINFRENWRGHLWQGRFSSFPMDETYLLAAARYVELNPVRAGLVADAAQWPWCSAGAHLAAADDGLVTVAPLLEIAGDWKTFLAGDTEDMQTESLRKHERTGRPLGAVAFVDGLEASLGRPLKREKPGPKRKAN